MPARVCKTHGRIAHVRRYAHRRLAKSNAFNGNAVDFAEQLTNQNERCAAERRGVDARAHVTVLVAPYARSVPKIA
eukprot:2696588-Rhodomonas_salina.2